MEDIRTKLQPDQKKIAELALDVKEQREKLSDTSSLTDEEVQDAADLEIEYFQEIARIVDDIREAEESKACDGIKISKEEKAFLKQWEDELTKAVNEFKALNKSGYLKDKADEVLESADTMTNKEDHKDSVEDALEDWKDRLEQYLGNLGYGEYADDAMTCEHNWTRYIKKPKKKDLEDAVRVLDEQQPTWTRQGEFVEMKALISTLATNFPDLVKKNAPLHELKGDGSSSGCLSMIVVGFLLATCISLKTFGVI